MPPQILRAKRKWGEEIPDVIYVGDDDASPAKRRNDGLPAPGLSRFVYRRIPSDISGAELRESLERRLEFDADGQLIVQDIAVLEALSAAAAAKRAAQAAPPPRKDGGRRSPTKEARRSPTKSERDSLDARFRQHRRFRVSKRETTSVAQLVAAQTRRAERASDDAPPLTHPPSQAAAAAVAAGVPGVGSVLVTAEAPVAAAPATPQRKRPSRAARAGLQRSPAGATAPRNVPHGDAAPDRENEAALLALARELETFAVKEAATPTETVPPRVKPLPTLHLGAPSPPHKFKYSPKAGVPRYHKRHGVQPDGGRSVTSSNDVPPSHAEVDMADADTDADTDAVEPSSDDDMVYELFVREPRGGAAAATTAAEGPLYRPTDPTAPVADHDFVGVLVMTAAEEELWREDEEAEAETRSLSDYEDENAEDFYTNDYPEEPEHDSEVDASDSSASWPPRAKKRALDGFGTDYVHSDGEDGNEWPEEDALSEEE